VIDQIGIAVLGVTAIALTQSKVESRRRCACLFGISAQPFWMWSAISAGQWGILALTFLYGFSWGKGVWQYWIEPRMKRTA
jgi:uncharacterized membrane protein